MSKIITPQKGWNLADKEGPMEEQIIADLKLRVAEHIIAQYECQESNDVRNIRAETKVGGGTKPTLQKILKMVFSAA